MTHTTYKFNDNNTCNNDFTNTYENIFGYYTEPEDTNASKTLTDLILDNLTDANPWMNNINKTPKHKFHNIFISKKKNIKKNFNYYIDLFDSIKYLSNYYDDGFNHNYKKIILPDGTIIRIFQDEIQINDTLLSIEDSKRIMDLLNNDDKDYIIKLYFTIKK